jgi:hypothetical protein
LNALEIKKKVKIIKDSRGKSIKVILPIRIFNELMEISISQEIYQDKSSQRSIRRAKKEVLLQKTKTFSNSSDAIEWLNE